MTIPWYERKQEVSEEEYESTVRALSGWADVERLPPGRTTGPSCRIAHRGTGKMIAGWDVDCDGKTTYFVIGE